MKNVKKNNKKFVIDMTNIESYDDAVIAIVEGCINNGTPVTKHLFAEYCDIVERDVIFDLMKFISDKGNTIRFDDNGFEICYTDAVELNDGDYIKADGERAVIKRGSLFKKFFNIFRRK